MATDLETLLVRIDATTEGLRRELRKADAAVAQSGRQMDGTLKRIDKSFRDFGKGMAAAFSVAAITSIGKQILAAADRYRTLQGRIREATRATGDYASVSHDLFAVSQRTGTALEENVAMFQRLGTGAREFGATNKDILKVTETVQKLGIIGGTSAASISAGTMQFAQAMAAGVVRAEEWNSIVENMPELANAIAASMGKTAGEMRQAILDGEVLSQTVFEGLKKQAADVDERFEALPLTIERASTKIANAFDKAAGESKELAKALQTTVDLMQWIADNTDAAMKPLNDRLEGTRRDVERIAQAWQWLKDEIVKDMPRLADALGIGLGVYQGAGANAPRGAFGPAGRGAASGGQSTVPVGSKSRGKTFEEKIREIEVDNQTIGGLESNDDYSRALRDDMRDVYDYLDDLERMRIAAQENAAALQGQGQALRESLDPMEALSSETMHLQRLLDAGAISSETFGLALTEAQHRALMLSDTMEGGLARALQGMEDSLSRLDWFSKDIFSSILGSFKGMINDMLNEAMRMNVWKPLFGGLLKGITGGITGVGGFSPGGGGSFLKFLDGRASGGPVTANTPYMVGENGPEMFVPGSSGGIVPNHKMGGGQGVVVNIHNHYDVGLESVDQRIRQHSPKIAAQAAQAVRNANQRTAGSFMR